MHDHTCNALTRLGVRSLLQGTVALIPLAGPLSSPLAAQSVRTIELRSVTAESSVGFTRIAGVRELRDGRVILVDSDERSIHVLDANLDPIRQIGRQGRGPGEYEWPAHIVALEGDSTGVFDTSLGRMLTILPDLGAGGVASLLAPMSPSSLSPARATAADRHGHLYGRGSPLARAPDGQYALGDSAPILRWSRSSPTRDTVAFVPVNVAPSSRVVAGAIATRAADRHPFGSEPQWTVAANGTVAIVHLTPYRVEVVSADGARQMGPELAFDPVLVSADHKQQWRLEQQRPRPQLSVTFATGESRSGLGTFPVTEPTWPATLPPFLPGAVRFDPDGTLWVRRSTAAGSPPTYDIFNDRGILASRYTLPASTRLVGFGKGCVYAVRIDQFDLEYLQRIALN